MGHSGNSEKTITKRSRKLLTRTTGLYTIHSANESSVGIGKDGFAIPVSLDQETRMFTVHSNMELTAEFHKTLSQSTPGLIESKKKEIST